MPKTNEFYSIQLESWEDKIIWDAEDAVVPSEDTKMEDSSTAVAKKTPTIPTDSFASRNYDLENGDWEESIMWDDHKPFKPFTHISLDMNDAHVLFDLTSEGMGEGFRGISLTIFFCLIVDELHGGMTLILFLLCHRQTWTESASAAVPSGYQQGSTVRGGNSPEAGD